MATNFKQAVHQNLECPICLSFFKDPKILSCSHTFCNDCLESLLESHADNEQLTCPVCREATPVPGQDVSRLQTNIAIRSLVEDVQTQGQVCANCDHKSGVAYCSDCGTYLCETCKEIHSKWAIFAGHSVVPTSDILSGKVLLKRRSKCQKHPNEDEECFCVDCGKYVCFRCGTLEHTNIGHPIVEAAVRENDQRKIINELLFHATAKLGNIDEYVTTVVKQRKNLQMKRQQLVNEIDKAFGEAIKKLTGRKELLRNEVDQQMETCDKLLEDMEETGRQHIVQINAACGLVRNGLKIPLQKESLTAHETLSQVLNHLMENAEHDEEQLRKATEEGDSIIFKKCLCSAGLELGKVRRLESTWTLHAEKDLPMKDSMHALAVSPHNSILVGSRFGGVTSYSPDGTLKETFLQEVKVRRLQCTEDSYIVRDMANNISVYTTELKEKLDVKFETQSNNEGGTGGLTVDMDGYILVGHSNNKTIQVFSPTGGKAINVIRCDGFEPWQIFAMNNNKRVVVSNYKSTVLLIDAMSGAIIYSTSRGKELYAYPSVCNDDSVIIAWVNHYNGLVRIDQYTGELQHTRNILSDFKISKPESNRPWYFLQQFMTGDIAFCTPDRLYIFRETWE